MTVRAGSGSKGTGANNSSHITGISSMAAIGEEFKPGDKVPNSGIYKVLHDKKRTEDHEVTCIAHKRFPPCRDCEHPRFVLVRRALHVEVHELFKDL